AKDPSSRPVTAGDVVEALDGIEISSATVPRFKTPGRVFGGWRSRNTLAAGLMLLLVAAAYLLRPRAEPLFACGTAALDSLWAGGNVTSVAVLPFQNTSGDTANERFSNGLTDALISALGRVCGLRVAARTTVFAAKTRGLTVREIGEKLGYA